jgi:hypothetical protein
MKLIHSRAECVILTLKMTLQDLEVLFDFSFWLRGCGEEGAERKMTSSVYFKMHHGNEVLAVNFTGHQIKLLDLKRAIMELKNISKGLDFDLKITDAENDQKSEI